MTMIMKIIVLWDVVVCGLVDIYYTTYCHMIDNRSRKRIITNTKGRHYWDIERHLITG